jgi:glycosyltransferase involved in cell wall biosynthesis
VKVDIGQAVILYDARWIGPHGIGRFATEIGSRLATLTPFNLSRRPWHPLDPFLLSAFLTTKKPDLFFSPGYNSPFPYSDPFVFTLHDLNHLRVEENSNAAKRAYYQYVIRPACHRAAFVLTVSEYSKHEIMDWANLKEERIINVGNGVGMPFTPVGRKHAPGYPYLLYVGSRKPHKNLSGLLKAYSVSGVSKDVRLILTGKPDPKTLQTIHSLGLRSDVVFVESYTDSDLSDLYRGALAFMFPSLYEGFGLPPLEALACGVPVLTSNVCSLPEVMGDAGLLVDPLDVLAIASGISRLVSDANLRTELIRKGLCRVKKFSWDETAKRTQEILSLALAGAQDYVCQP